MQDFLYGKLNKELAKKMAEKTKHQYMLKSNAYQDVQNKIDFIINTKQKRRGVGVNRDEVSFEEKSIGIQFTTNISKAEHKTDQINKAKERGVEVDDIVYVQIDNKILQEAVKKWEANNKPISGPLNFLSAEVRTSMLKNLFKGLLNEDQEKSLLKNLK